MAGLLLVLALGLAGAAGAASSADVIAAARQASSEGRRAEGIALLEQHLTETPRDVDARLVLGLLLSWEGRYEDARRELEHVLGQAPAYTDARVALMNVEWWSGREAEARDHAAAILAEHTGHPEAQRMYDRLSPRPWTAKLGYGFDWFDQDRDPWHEASLSLSRETDYGSVILRGSRAERFDNFDQLIELETYPKFRPGTYAYLAVAAGTRWELYPRWRVGADLYQNLGWGFEGSLGYRRLQFDRGTDIYVATLTKYLGNWMLMGRVNYVPGDGDSDSTSGYATLRRYFGEAGQSYVGLSYGHGLSREEVTIQGDVPSSDPNGAPLPDEIDFEDLDSDSLALELNWEPPGRLIFGLRLGSSREERANDDALWHHFVSTSVGVRF